MLTKVIRRFDERRDFSRLTLKKCKDFAIEVYDTNKDEYIRRGQKDRGRTIIQIMNGKLLELHGYEVFKSEIPDLTPPNFDIQDKKNKSWEPDMCSKTVPISLALKAKDSIDAELWTPSWIFGTNDREIFGPKLDGKNLDPNQYVCMGMVDSTCRECWFVACVNLLWIHEWKLFAPPDRDTVFKKKTIRFDYKKDGVLQRFEKDGVEYDSIMDIVREHYYNDDNILWQL